MQSVLPSCREATPVAGEGGQAGSVGVGAVFREQGGPAVGAQAPRQQQVQVGPLGAGGAPAGEAVQPLQNALALQGGVLPRLGRRARGPGLRD